MHILENLTAFVTGAGSGIGKAIAHRYASQGANVFITDIREDRLLVVADEIRQAGGKVAYQAGDLADEKAVQSLIDACRSAFGEVDILVNNAGILDHFMPAAEVSSELWKRVMQVNVDGPFYACHAVLPGMVERGKGIIINISSIGGLQGSRAGAAYTTSKHALIGLTKNIGFQYATKGIRCNAIAPGGVNTAISEGVQPSPFGYERLMSGIGSNIRSAEPDEIAGVALFLASPDASFVNGAVVTADGGWTAY
jgi:NAD(P)-dependent dehydrogenase (short-subunit alcohol dehydrogenase family)